MASGTIHARHVDGRMHTTDTIISPTMRITTGVRINAEKAPHAPPGSFGVAWTGGARDGSGRVSTQIDVDQVMRDIEGGLSLLTDAEQRAIRAKLTKFSGREASATSAVGVATNRDSLTMDQGDTIREINERNRSFWDNRLSECVTKNDHHGAKDITKNGRRWPLSPRLGGDPPGIMPPLN